MTYIVRLRKTDGTLVDLPDIYPGDAPWDATRIGIPFQGGMIDGKVERCVEQHWFNGLPQTSLQTTPAVVATRLRWIERKQHGTAD